MTFVITIDGPAGAGKGTLGRALAHHYNLALLETGLLYRCVGLKALRQQVALTDEYALAFIARDLKLEDLTASDLRTPAASDASSRVSIYPQVRQALFEFQQHFAQNPPRNFQGTILDGRDTGTVICPYAPVKFFITASVEIRAERRLKELQTQAIESIYTTVLTDMKERDARDSQRTEAPLRVATEALVIDTSLLNIQDVLTQAIAFVELRRSFFEKDDSLNLERF